MLYDCGLPPDLVCHRDPSVMDTERPWGIPSSVFSPIWERVTGRGVRVAVIDTGYQAHSLLPDPVEYLNLTNETNRLLNSHGIHVSSTALGREGFGVAPAADLISIKVLAGRGGAGSSDWIANGIRKAVDLKADVINLSLGGDSPYRPTQDALQYAFERGCCVVAASGNSGFNGRDNSMGYPARYDTNVVAVGATQGPYLKQTLANFSSGGREMDLCAPGDRILGAVASNQVGYMSGTSMATPYIAGLYALAIELLRLAGKKRPETYQQWKELFSSIALDAGVPGFDHYYGYGIPMIGDIIRILDQSIQSWGL